MSISNAMLLRFASGLPHGFWDRQRFELVPNIILRVCCKKMCKQSSQQSDQSCFCTNTRTTHRRQNKPYRLGAASAGVVGSRGCCCPAATVLAAVVSACGVCCCTAEKNKKKIINRKTELCHHRPRSKAQSNEYENNTHTRQNNHYRLGLAPAGVIGARGRCCPAATVPVAFVIARVVCCCIAKKKQTKTKQKQPTPGISVLL